MTTTTTPGALRASREIVAAVQKTFKQLGYPTEKPATVQALTSAFAEIIDRETKAPEMLAALDDALWRLGRLGSEETGRCETTEKVRALVHPSP